jgi:predicted nucleotidyltransferase
LKTISSIQELKIPEKHKKFISEFLKQARYIETFDKIDMFILFGSCARGNATASSDVDILAVGENLGDETLFDLYDCAYYPGLEEKINFVGNDIFVNARDYFEENKNITGSFQWRVAKDGVVLNGLLEDAVPVQLNRGIRVTP